MHQVYPQLICLSIVLYSSCYVSSYSVLQHFFIDSQRHFSSICVGSELSKYFALYNERAASEMSAGWSQV